MSAHPIAGVVIAAYGRHYVVHIANGTQRLCFTRGKKSDVACGDRVHIETNSADQGIITQILPRTNLIYRSDAYRSKLLAANITQLMIIVATQPAFSQELLGRALVCGESLALPILIVLNKIDLPADTAQQCLALYQNLGYEIHAISVHARPEATSTTLLPLLHQHTTLMVGQSGMGKSSLLNLLVPGAEAATREISQALQSGKHTTTLTRQYQLPLPNQGILIDSPGFQEFGLAHLTPGVIERAFREMRDYLGQCHFYNCTHLAEPGCAVRAAVAQGTISARRYDLFVQLLRELTKD